MLLGHAHEVSYLAKQRYVFKNGVINKITASTPDRRGVCTIHELCNSHLLHSYMNPAFPASQAGKQFLLDSAPGSGNVRYGSSPARCGIAQTYYGIKCNQPVKPRPGPCMAPSSCRLDLDNFLAEIDAAKVYKVARGLLPCKLTVISLLRRL